MLTGRGNVSDDGAAPEPLARMDRACYLRHLIGTVAVHGDDYGSRALEVEALRPLLASISSERRTPRGAGQ